MTHAYANLTLGVASYSPTLLLVFSALLKPSSTQARAATKLLFPPFIRCRHIMSGIMTKLAKKKNPCFSSTTRLTMHYCTKESGRLAFFPHSSWGSTSSAQRKTGKNALRSSNQVYSISKPNELVN